MLFFIFIKKYIIIFTFLNESGDLFGHNLGAGFLQYYKQSDSD